MNFKPEETKALNTLAGWLGVPAAWIYSLIMFESTWNPLARNKKSGARGLIQFMPQTARDLGYKTADEIVEKYPAIASQLLGPVAAYFKLPGKRGPYPTKQSLYMAVFYPTHRDVPPDTMFSAKARKANPGIDTVQDYVNYVEGIHSQVKGGTGFVLFLILLGGGYLTAKYLKLI
jgi:hypothetical protein